MSFIYTLTHLPPTSCVGNCQITLQFHNHTLKPQKIYVQKVLIHNLGDFDEGEFVEDPNPFWYASSCVPIHDFYAGTMSFHDVHYY